MLRVGLWETGACARETVDECCDSGVRNMQKGLFVLIDG